MLLDHVLGPGQSEQELKAGNCWQEPKHCRWETGGHLLACFPWLAQLSSFNGPGLPAEGWDRPQWVGSPTSIKPSRKCSTDRATGRSDGNNSSHLGLCQNLASTEAIPSFSSEPGFLLGGTPTISPYVTCGSRKAKQCVPKCAEWSLITHSDICS